MRGTIVAQIAISQADKSVQKREIIMGKHLFLDWGDATKAVCEFCGHPFGSKSIIAEGSRPECHAQITSDDRKAAWCVVCGNALHGDEAGLELCWECLLEDML
jgi:hypothetical protein